MHSPKCGSGNKPIDKGSSTFLLKRILKQSRDASFNVHFTEIDGRDSTKKRKASSEIHRVGIFDLETQRSANEVGGWHRADKMGISCAVIFDSANNDYSVYKDDQIHGLMDHLMQFDRIVGFNIKRFDYHVLRGYSDFDFSKLRTLDILEDVHNYLGFRLSLGHLVRTTLGIEKEGDGLQALQWWKQGRISKIIDYCKRDVKITKDLYLFGKKNKYLLFNNKAGHTVRIPVNW